MGKNVDPKSGHLDNISKNFTLHWCGVSLLFKRMDSAARLTQVCTVPESRDKRVRGKNVARSRLKKIKKIFLQEMMKQFQGNI